MKSINIEVFGFKFQSLQLVDIRHQDGSSERTIGTAKLAASVQAGDVEVLAKYSVLRIAHQDQEVFVPIMETGAL